MSLRVAVVGAGYWGINHVRAMAAQRDGELAAVCDSDPAARQRAARLVNVPTVEDFGALLADPRVDALILATPAVSHAEQARRALAAGKHVLVEKPMTLSPADARSLVEGAEAAQRVLMVGHVMLYHPAYLKLRELVHSGALGDVYYLYALRVNLGRLRRDENALWSLAPHDVSMILDLLGASPVTVAARGQSYLQPGIEDVVFVNLAFPDRKMAQIQISWLDPRKERRLTVVGARKMVEFDDAHPSEKLRIYDKGYDRPPAFTQYGEYLTIRQGDVHIPRVDGGEPLDLEIRHFLACIRDGMRPRSDAAHGAAVVEVLNAAQRSLETGGTPIQI